MTTLLDRWIHPAEREALQRPIEHARGLPGRLYGADFHAVEQRALFPHTWAAVEGNWKLAIEGAIEDYHLPLAHPQLFDGIGNRPR